MEHLGTRNNDFLIETEKLENEITTHLNIKIYVYFRNKYL